MDAGSSLSGGPPGDKVIPRDGGEGDEVPDAETNGMSGLSGGTQGDKVIPSDEEEMRDEDDVGKALNKGDDQKKEPPAPRKSSRVMRSDTNNGADADAMPQPGRKSMRLQKDADKTAGRPKRKAPATGSGSGGMNKVCLPPLTVISLQN